MKIIDRYASATRATNLKAEADTVRAVDVLGAAGYAGVHSPLAMNLLRIFVGDARGAADVVALLSGMAWGKAKTEGIKLRRVQADDMARAVLAWLRDGVCGACEGRQFVKMKDAPALMAQQCPACRGSGRRPFEAEFAIERRLIARWLLAETERELAKAGPAAMAALAPKMDL